MVAAFRLARERFRLPILFPAALSWLFLFGYQWAFSLGYHGSQPTVFSYYSGIVGDGVLIPALNVGAFVLLRQLWPNARWWRLPLYVALALVTAFAAFVAQAGLGVVNWSMPSPFHWSSVGRFHFVVMWAELSYLYVAMAVAVNNWGAMRRDETAWRAFWMGWLAIALFALSLLIDVARFSH